MVNFFKKNWGNILLILIIALLFIPQTGTPIRVFVQRLIATNPSEVNVEDRKILDDYNWQLSNLDGKFENLEQSKNKVVLINLWATWCPPCLAEMPSFQKLYDSYGDRVDFYFVSSEDKNVLKKFEERKGYNLPIFIQQAPIPKILASDVLPTTYLISKSGEIIISETGVADWNSDEIKTLLDTLLSE